MKTIWLISFRYCDSWIPSFAFSTRALAEAEANNKFFEGTWKINKVDFFETSREEVIAEMREKEKVND